MAQALLKNIRLVWKFLKGTNTLAYFIAGLIALAKGLIGKALNSNEKNLNHGSGEWERKKEKEGEEREGKREKKE